MTDKAIKQVAERYIERCEEIMRGEPEPVFPQDIVEPAERSWWSRVKARFR